MSLVERWNHASDRLGFNEAIFLKPLIILSGTETFQLNVTGISVRDKETEKSQYDW